MNWQYLANMNQNSLKISFPIIILSLLIITLSLITMVGWIFRMPFILDLRAAYLLITFNSALCFLLAIIGILLTFSELRLARLLQLGIGVFLILFPGAVLYQSLFNINLGLDQIFVYAWISNLDLVPGRMLPNTSFGFILFGTALILSLFDRSKIAFVVSQILLFLVFSIGLLGVIGYILELDTIFTWYNFTKMSLGGAIGFIMLSICFWLISKQKQALFFHLNPAQRISILTGVILFIVALIVGLTGFGVVAEQYEKYLKLSLQSTLHDKAAIIQGEMDIVDAALVSITKNPKLHQAVVSQEIDSLKELANFLLEEGFSGIQILDKEGTPLIEDGQFVKDPQDAIKLHSPEALLFIFNKKLALQLSKPILINGIEQGTLVAEWPLPKIDRLFSLARENNIEFLMCSPVATQNIYCLSSETLSRLNASQSTNHLLDYTVDTHVKKGILGEQPRHIFITHSSLEELGLTLLHKADLRETFNPVFKPLIIVIPVILLTILVSSVLLYWKMMPLVKRIVKSEQKAALREKQLEETESYTRAVIDNVGEGIITIDTKGIIQSCNKALSDIFGYTLDEIIGQNFVMLMPPSYRAKHKEGLARYLKTGEATIIGKGAVELEGLHKNGTVFPLELTVGELNIGRQHLFTGILRNLSYRKKAEAKFKSLLEGAQDALVIINDKAEIVMSNIQTEKLFGYEKGELIDEKIHFLIPEDTEKAKKDTDYFSSTQTSGRGNLELQGQHKDGNKIPIEVSVSPVDTEEGKLTLLSIRDITERKRVEKLKNEFISVVSHELRTPLTSILGSLSLLVSNTLGKFPPKAENLLGIAKKNSERLIRLINDILDIEKIESGKMEFRLMPIPLSSLMQEAIMANLAYGDKFSVNLKLIKPIPDVKVNVDRDRLLQVLANLISNAVKFSPKGGKVTLEATLQPRNKIRVCVSDKGEGIPRDFRSSIFQKFAQADTSAVRAHEGTGLGLSISKAIIEKLDGDIGFKTKTHQGTTFFFDLPIWQPEKVTTHKQKRKYVPTVLIIEDDINVTNLLQVILEQHGLNLLIAHTAAEAKALLKKHHIDALLLDLVLPDQDGISLIKEIKETKNISNLPIVVLSIEATMHKNELNGSAFTVLDWVDKPIDPERLLNVIQTIKDYIVAKNNKKKRRILHVEDDTDLTEIIANLVQHSVEIKSVSTLKKAKDLLNQENFDLVILDLMLPDGSGAELLSQLSRDQVPVVIFSAYELPQEYVTYVSSILMKSKASNEELLQAIKAAITAKK